MVVFLPSLICWRPCLVVQTFSQHTPLLPDTPGHMRHRLVLRDRGQDDPGREHRRGQVQGLPPRCYCPVDDYHKPDVWIIFVFHS